MQHMDMLAMKSFVEEDLKNIDVSNDIFNPWFCESFLTKFLINFSGKHARLRFKKMAYIFVQHDIFSVILTYAILN